MQISEELSFWNSVSELLWTICAQGQNIRSGISSDYTLKQGSCNISHHWSFWFAFLNKPGTSAGYIWYHSLMLAEGISWIILFQHLETWSWLSWWHVLFSATHLQEGISRRLSSGIPCSYLNWCYIPCCFCELDFIICFTFFLFWHYILSEFNLYFKNHYHL